MNFASPDGTYDLMARAIVFINAFSGTPELVKDLGKIEGVREAHSSLGMYDAVAMVQADSLGQVKDIVTKQIRTMDRVKSTLTLTVVDPP